MFLETNSCSLWWVELRVSDWLEIWRFWFWRSRPCNGRSQGDNNCPPIDLLLENSDKRRNSLVNIDPIVVRYSLNRCNTPSIFYCVAGSSGLTYHEHNGALQPDDYGFLDSRNSLTTKAAVNEKEHHKRKVTQPCGMSRQQYLHWVQWYYYWKLSSQIQNSVMQSLWWWLVKWG